MRIGNRIIEVEFVSQYGKNPISFLEVRNTNKIGIGFEKNRKVLEDKIVNTYYVRLSFLKFRLIFKTYKLKRGIQFYIGKRQFQIYTYSIFSKKDREERRFRELELSIWHRKHKTVGEKNFKDVENWNKNLVNSHHLGIKLIIFEIWFQTSKGAKILKIEKNNNYL